MRRKLSIKIFQNYFLLLSNRKFKLQRYNKLFFISLFTILISVHSNGQYTTKVVEFDWKKKEFTEGKSRFPFDEPFTFKVINLPEGSLKTDLCITLKDILPKVKDPEISTVIEGSVTDGSRVFNGIVENYLPPNHYYKVDISGKTERKLNEEEKEKLKDVLSSSELKRIFLHKIFEYTKLFDYKKELKSFLSEKGFSNYEIDFSKLNEQIQNAIYLADATNDLRRIANDLDNICGAIKRKINNNDKSKIVLLFENFYSKNENNVYSPKINKDESYTDFIMRYTELNPFKNEIKSKFIDTVKDTINKQYLIEKLNELDSIKTHIDSFETHFNAWIDNEIIEIIVKNTSLMSLLGSNIYDSDTEASIYTSQTFGYGYSPNTDNGLMYFTFSFYLRPVNNNVPLSNVTGQDWWKVRFCANIGLTLEDIKTNNYGTVSGLGSPFGEKAGLVGVGFRPWSFLKIDINSLFYYMNDPNPLITNKKFTASPLFGVSLNLNLVKLLSKRPNSLTTLTDEINN